MKTTLLFAIMVIWSLSLKAQEYHPLIEDDKVWLEAYYIPANFCEYESVYTLRIVGDTLIEGQTYRKILYHYFNTTSGGPYCPPFVPTGMEYVIPDAFIRENIDTRQVFMWIVDYYNPDGHEVLLYDFNLDVGDTIPISDYATNNQVITIQSVEEHTLENGETRKKFNYSGDEFFEYNSFFIEGIGGEFGFFRPFWIWYGEWWKTHCVQQNQEFLYQIQGIGPSCNWIITSNPEVPTIETSLFPNPSSGNFILELNHADFGSAELQLTVFSMTGQQILSLPVRADHNRFQINAGSGLYLWQLQSNGEILNSGKLVVE